MSIENDRPKKKGTERMNAADWYDDDKKEVNVADMKKNCKMFFEQKAKIKKMDDAVKDEREKLRKMEKKLLAYLEEAGLEKFASPQGTIFTKEYFSTKVPKDPENREKFFNYLKKEGIFEDLITVHSNTLNSYYQSKIEEDPSFEMPGLGPATYQKKLNARKK